MTSLLETIHRPVVGRFAPSPTGRMHAGNIYAALLAWLVAKSQNGSIVLRIEDLDRDRSKPEYIDALLRDFEALGLTWDKGPYFQSDRNDIYEDALKELSDKHHVYPCFCTRADLHAASAPHRGEKPIYAGTCRYLQPDMISVRQEQRKPAMRIEVPDRIYSLHDGIQGYYQENLKYDCGDFVIKRMDGSFAYQLAVVIDDADQGVNSIVRGVDLLSSTPQQIFLREALNKIVDVHYTHIPLLVAEKGRRLSKRDADASLDELYARYATPEGIIGHIAYLTSIRSADEPVTPEELLKEFSYSKLRDSLPSLTEIYWY